MGMVNHLLVLPEGGAQWNSQRFDELLRTGLGAKVVSSVPDRVLAKLSDNSTGEALRIHCQGEKISRAEAVTLIWIAALSITDTFVYFHCQAGAVQRKLILGVPNQFEWSLVEGVPEPWEAEAFADEVFDPDVGAESASEVSQSPFVGAVSPGADAMHFATCALRYWKISSRLLSLDI